jgi:hypothetical protein
VREGEREREIYIEIEQKRVRERERDGTKVEEVLLVKIFIKKL